MDSGLDWPGWQIVYLVNLDIQQEGYVLPHQKRGRLNSPLTFSLDHLEVVNTKNFVFSAC
jgi:hypothetical protein